MIFHVLNRGNARDGIFDKEAAYAVVEMVLLETPQQVFVRILSYCLMPNHWHLVLWPLSDGDLGRFMQRLTTTHVRRWHLDHRTGGTGHLYQGTYKSRSKRTTISTWCYVMSNATRDDRRSRNARKIGDGAACGDGRILPTMTPNPFFAPGRFHVRGTG